VSRFLADHARRDPAWGNQAAAPGSRQSGRVLTTASSMRFAPPGSAILKALPRSPRIWTHPVCKVKHTGFGEGKGCCHLSGLWLGIRIPTASMENSCTSPGTSYWPQKPLRSNRFERCRSDRSCHRACVTNATVVGRCLSRLVLTAPVPDRGSLPSWRFRRR